MNAEMMMVRLMPVKRYTDGAVGPVAANDPDALFDAYRVADLLAELAAMAAMNAAPERRAAA